MTIRKYNPDDFASPLREDLLRAYELIEHKHHAESRSAVIDIFFDVKEAVKFKEIEPDDGKAMQNYFWGLV